MLRLLTAGLAAVLLSACEPPREPDLIDGQVPDMGQMRGSTATAAPMAGAPGQHPQLAAPGLNSMHADSYSSDVHELGPLGRNPQFMSRIGSPLPGGQCATITFDRGGRLVALCASIAGFEIHLLAPRSLELLARYALPARPSSFQALVKRDADVVMSDSSGGAYFSLDAQDRVILADSRQRILRIAHRQTATGEWEFYLDGEWDLRAQVPHDCMNWDNWSPEGECDPMTAVMPDHQGLIWWVTRRGRIGTLDPDRGVVQNIALAGEEIQNGFSVAADGVYIVSDHAMYGLRADASGTPQIVWRETYDRGSGRKVGSINQGSGTTPTLLGEQYVTVTDNADERIRLLVYRRQPAIEGERLICAVPLFAAGASATDNSMIGWGRAIIIENNHGYRNASQQRDWSAVTGGITRVDIREDESGCDVVWHSPEKSPSVVPKLAWRQGLVYFYTFELGADGELQWYLLALDAHSGETRWRIPTGRGRHFDNNWAPITLGPDGTAYVGTFKGLVAIWDGE